MPTYTTIDVNRITGIAKAVFLATRQAQGDAYNASVFADKVRYNEEFVDAVKSADAFVYAAILDNKQHRYRSLFYQQEIVADGAEIPNEFVGGVQIQVGGTYYPGIEMSPDVIIQLRLQKPTYGTTTTVLDQGYYAIRGNQIYFTGTNAKVETLPLIPPAFPMTPVDYELPVLYGVMASLAPREGVWIEMANHYASLWSTALQMIRENVTADEVPQDSPPYSLVYPRR